MMTMKTKYYYELTGESSNIHQSELKIVAPESYLGYVSTSETQLPGELHTIKWGICSKINSTN